MGENHTSLPQDPTKVLELLRRVIVRLSFLAHGFNPTLDRKLHELRAALKTGYPIAALLPLTEDISTALVQLEEKRLTTTLDPWDVILKLAEEVRPPDLFRKKIRQLSQQVKQRGEREDLLQAVEGYIELLNEAFSQTGYSFREEFFGKEESAFFTHSLAEGDKGESPAVMPKRQIGSTTVSQVAPPESVVRVPSRTEKQPEEEISPPLKLPEKEPVAAPPPPRELIFQELIQKLLSHPALIPHVGHLKSTLLEKSAESPHYSQQVDLVARHFAELFNRQLAPSEPSLNLSTIFEFFTHTQGYLDRLQELLKDIQVMQEEARESRYQMDMGIQNQLQGIQGHVQESRDLDALKKSLIGRLSGIRINAEGFRRSDDLRIQQFEQWSLGAEQQLTLLQQHINQIQERITIAMIPREKWDHESEEIEKSLGEHGEALARLLVTAKLSPIPHTLILIRLANYRTLCGNHRQEAAEAVIDAVLALIRQHLGVRASVSRYDIDGIVLILGNPLVSVQKMIEPFMQDVSGCSAGFEEHTFPIQLAYGMTEFFKEDSSPLQALERAKRQIQDQVL